MRCSTGWRPGVVEGGCCLPRPPVLASGFRTWFFDQVARQARGREPEPWPEWWAVHGDGSAPVPHGDVLGSEPRT